MNGLSSKDQKQFSQIIFSLPQPERNQQIEGMSDRQRQKLKLIMCQKIIDQATKKQMLPPKQRQQQFTLTLTKPGFLSTILCCFYPQDNRHNFDITTKIFLRRFCGVFLICKTNFLKFGIPKIKKGKRLQDDPTDKNAILQDEEDLGIDGRTNTPDLYGPLWITISYCVLLSICANLNQYFINKPDSYVFDTAFLSVVNGIVLLYMILQSLVYKAAVGCLKGAINTAESLCLIGYSQVLYFIPTILCVIPSLYIHLIALVVGGLIRTVFLYRNYGKFLESKKQTLIPIFLFVQFFYFYSLMRAVFMDQKTYSITDAANAVIAHKMGFNLRSHVY